MYRKELEEISEKLSPEKSAFYIITHKKHKREIYFRNTPEAIAFLRRKMRGHKLVYFLIKKNFIRPFLKQVSLSATMGDVVFVANEIKCFCLNERLVISFPLNFSKAEFLEQKCFQQAIAKDNYAPEVFEIDKEIPFSKEELLKEYGGDLSIVLAKLMGFYKKYKLIHGDLVGASGNIIYEHILKKRNSCVFIDWGCKK